MLTQTPQNSSLLLTFRHINLHLVTDSFLPEQATGPKCTSQENIKCPQKLRVIEVSGLILNVNTLVFTFSLITYIEFVVQ
jgi:hypothetical protein